MLQQYLPLAVLKQDFRKHKLACSKRGLQQYLPLAVLKLKISCSLLVRVSMLQQYLPLAVLKLAQTIDDAAEKVATVLTACGIETLLN